MSGAEDEWFSPSGRRRLIERLWELPPTSNNIDEIKDIVQKLDLGVSYDPTQFVLDSGMLNVAPGMPDKSSHGMLCLLPCNQEDLLSGILASALRLEKEADKLDQRDQMALRATQAAEWVTATVEELKTALDAKDCTAACLATWRCAALFAEYNAQKREWRTAQHARKTEAARVKASHAKGGKVRAETAKKTSGAAAQMPLGEKEDRAKEIAFIAIKSGQSKQSAIALEIMQKTKLGRTKAKEIVRLAAEHLKWVKGRSALRP